MVPALPGLMSTFTAVEARLLKAVLASPEIEGTEK
jgi:hypothetical protein